MLCSGVTRGAGAGGAGADEVRPDWGEPECRNEMDWGAAASFVEMDRAGAAGAGTSGAAWVGSRCRHVRGAAWHVGYGLERLGERSRSGPARHGSARRMWTGAARRAWLGAARDVGCGLCCAGRARVVRDGAARAGSASREWMGSQGRDECGVDWRVMLVYRP